MPLNTLVIAPVDKLDELLSVTNYAPTAPLYTLADLERPRVVSHRARNGRNTSAQQALLDAATVEGVIVAVNIDPSLEGCLFKSWNLPGEVNPYAATLAAEGLTTDPNV